MGSFNTCHFFTALIDYSIAIYHPDVLNGRYSEVWGSGPALGGYSNSFTTMIGNILFQMTVLVPIYGTNSPLWSLSNEFAYYCFFPLTLFSIFTIKRFSFWHCGSLLVAILLLALPQGFLGGFFIFCMGAFISYLIQSQLCLIKVKINVFLGVLFLLPR